MSQWESNYKAGQQVKIVGDQTMHLLPLGSTQTIDHIDYEVGLPAIVIMDRNEDGQYPRYLVESDVRPLDTLTA